VRGARSIAIGACACALLIASGCQGRQDEGEPRGNFPVKVSASFPTSQRLSQTEVLRVHVRNTGTKPIPNVAATITSKGKGTEAEAFAQSNQQVGLQSRSRPIWIVDGSPKGGETAFANTWAVGSLDPGKSTTLTWRVTPAKPGQYGITYRLSAGLYGKARAVLPGGGMPKGSFDVTIKGTPRQARVADDGSIVNGGAPDQKAGSKP
jgi:hypothetical protein